MESVLRRKRGLQWEGLAEQEGFKPVMKDRGGMMMMLKVECDRRHVNLYSVFVNEL